MYVADTGMHLVQRAMLMAVEGASQIDSAFAPSQHGSAMFPAISLPDALETTCNFPSFFCRSFGSRELRLSRAEFRVRAEGRPVEMRSALASH